MNARNIMIVAALAGLWYWHKKRGTATPATAGTDPASTKADDAQGWMGAWGLTK